jgi:hypothetical protein
MLLLVLLFVTSVSTLSEHEVCGGYGWSSGPTCDPPLKCIHRGRYVWTCEYKCPGGDWECTPDSTDLAIAGPWEQCGGKEWQGPTQCVPYPCQERCEYYSQCRPDCPEGWRCSKIAA